MRKSRWSLKIKHRLKIKQKKKTGRRNREINNSSSWKIIKFIRGLKSTYQTTWPDDIHKTSQQWQKTYSLLWKRNIYQDNLSQKTPNICKFKRIESTQRIFSYRDGIILEMCNRKISEKSPNVWKVNSLLNNLWESRVLWGTSAGPLRKETEWSILYLLV